MSERWTEDRLRTVIAARIQCWIPSASMKKSFEATDRILVFFKDWNENEHDCSLDDILDLMNGDKTPCDGYCGGD